MKATAATLSVLALVLGGLPLFQRRSTRPTAVMLMFAKFFGAALAPYVAIAAALSAVLGIAYDSALCGRRRHARPCARGGLCPPGQLTPRPLRAGLRR